MNTETISYSEGGDAFDAVIARPDGPGPHAAVLVCHAWGGRDAFAEDKAQELAALGYVGAAIDVYGVGKRGHDQPSCQALMTHLINDPQLLRRRLLAAHGAIAALQGVDAKRTGTIGYCFGGLCAILMARMGLPLRGVVSFHGLLKIGERLDEAVKAKLLILHGQDDPMVPPPDIGEFAAEMQRINADWTLHAYPGVMHAFTNPQAAEPSSGMLYDAHAAQGSWEEMTRFLHEVLA